MLVNKLSILFIRNHSNGLIPIPLSLLEKTLCSQPPSAAPLTQWTFDRDEAWVTFRIETVQPEHRGETSLKWVTTLSQLFAQRDTSSSFQKSHQTKEGFRRSWTTAETP